MDSQRLLLATRVAKKMHTSITQQRKRPAPLNPADLFDADEEKASAALRASPFKRLRICLATIQNAAASDSMPAEYQQVEEQYGRCNISDEEATLRDGAVNEPRALAFDVLMSHAISKSGKIKPQNQPQVAPAHSDSLAHHMQQKDHLNRSSGSPTSTAVDMIDQIVRDPFRRVR